MSFNIKGDDMINFAYLMYLDMIHDTTIPKSMPFKTFCGETITVSVKVPAPTTGNKKATKTVKKTQNHQFTYYLVKDSKLRRQSI